MLTFIRFVSFQILLFTLIDFTFYAIYAKKTVIITGANRGIGLATTKILAASNEWNIIAACRSVERANAAFKSITGSRNILVKQLDLSDLSSIQSFSQDLKNAKIPIDVLVCNAGVQFTDNKVPPRTVQGFEETVGTNHIGHFFLSTSLVDILDKSDYARLVFVGSGVHNPDEAGGGVGAKATLGDMRGLSNGFKNDISMIDGGPYSGDKAYKDSKLCNVATSLEFARRLQKRGSQITSNVMNPGLIPTSGLFRGLNPLFVAIFTLLTRYVFRVAVSEEVGGERLAFMVTNPILNGITGAYYSGDPFTGEFRPSVPSKEASDPVTGSKLWALTDQLIRNEGV